MSKAIRRGFIFVLLVLVPILIVDYYVDSYAAFRVTYNKIGKTAVESNYCVGTDIPLSERKAKWAKVNSMDAVDYMVLGSSRSMLFSSEDLSIPSFYNMAVSGGSSVRDYMAEVYILYHQKKLPPKMLIEISPSLLNANSGEDRWTEWGNSSEYMREVLDGQPVDADDSYLLGVQIKDLLSPDYFKYNYELLRAGKRTYFVTNEFEDDENFATQHVDGSYSYSRVFQEENNEESILESIWSICESNSIYCCGNYEEISAELLYDFERLLLFLDDNGVDVSFYLPPYAAPMYDYICTEEYYKSILRIEEWVMEYSAKQGIQVYGSYDPRSIGLELTDLYDAYHVKANKQRDTLWVRNLEAPNEWLR